jgi:hypothetical protein
MNGISPRCSNPAATIHHLPDHASIPAALADSAGTRRRRVRSAGRAIRYRARFFATLRMTAENSAHFHIDETISAMRRHKIKRHHQTVVILRSAFGDEGSHPCSRNGIDATKTRSDPKPGHQRDDSAHAESEVFSDFRRAAAFCSSRPRSRKRWARLSRQPKWWECRGLRRRRDRKSGRAC